MCDECDSSRDHFTLLQHTYNSVIFTIVFLLLGFLGQLGLGTKCCTSHRYAHWATSACPILALFTAIIGIACAASAGSDMRLFYSSAEIETTLLSPLLHRLLLQHHQFCVLLPRGRVGSEGSICRQDFEDARSAGSGGMRHEDYAMQAGPY
jgi:hypothetical protein